MKKIGFFNIFPVLLALALFFAACSSHVDGDTSDTKPQTPPASNNGNLFFAYAPDGKTEVYISVYSTTTKAVKAVVIPPKTGDSYAAVALTRYADGESNYDTATKTKGTITVSGDTLTFSGNNYTGRLSNTTLTMTQVPGTTYKPLTMSLHGTNGNIKATSDKPFGQMELYPPDVDPVNPTNPTDPTTSTNPTNPSNQPNKPADFEPGYYVTGVEVTKAPKNKIVFEGQAVKLDGLNVVISYSNGPPTTIIVTTETDARFIISPPGYGKPGEVHTLKYVAEYYDGPVKYSQSITTPEPSIPRPGLTASGFLQPWEKRSGTTLEEAYYELGTIDDDKKPSSTKIPWTPNNTTPDRGTLVEKYEGFNYVYTPPLTIKGTYITSYTPPTVPGTSVAGTASSAKNATHPADIFLAYTVVDTHPEYNLVFGAGTGTIPGAITGSTNFNYNQARSYKLPNEVHVYHLKEITVPNPTFKEQITFDDPRFFNSNAKENWYRHLAGTTIGLVYEDNTKKQQASIVTLASRTDTDINKRKIFPIKLTDFPSPSGGWGTRPQLEFTYVTSQPSTGSIKTKLDIPLYDTLLSVGFDPRSTPIELDGNKTDDEKTFLMQARPYAVYQKSNNKNDTVKKKLFDDYGFNLLWINGGSANIVTNVTRDGILNAANSVAYDKNKKLQKVNFTFNAFDGHLRTYGAPSQSVSNNTLQVGVKNYGN
jgi:hypothetical protein